METAWLITSLRRCQTIGALGHPEALVNAWFTPDFCGRLGYASYELTNNNANIRRIKARIAELGRNENRETKETEVEGGIRMVENAEINRVQLFFPGKPSGAVRTMLKSYGFRWSPMEGAEIHAHDKETK